LPSKLPDQMKIKLNTNLLINLVIVIYITFLLVLYVFSSYNYPPKSSIYVLNNLKPIDTTLSDSLSYRQYNKLNDSIKQVRNFKNGDFTSGNGFYIGFIGTTASISCDTCTFKWHIWHGFNDKANEHYYIKLMFWKIKNTESIFWYADSVQFHVEHEQSFLRKVIMGSPKIKDKYGNFYHGRLVDVPVKFRYNSRDQSLLIPVSKSTKNIFDYVFGTVGIITAGYYFYLIGIFLSFIVDLSKGNAFTDKNIFRLKLITISLILLPVIVFLLNLLIKVLLHNYFTADVVMNYDMWKNVWKIIGLGLIFLLLYRAFRQGKILKDEQDLTV